MFQEIHWRENAFYIGDTPSYIISGDFHYFRVPKEDWEERLQFFKDGGINCVATYIPWALHEPREGQILFGDNDSRDLEEFIKLCNDLNLYVTCRPGPYQYTEMYYGGLPEWLCEGYPELLALDAKGNVFNSQKSSVSYLHPLFLEKAKRWFQVLSGVLRPYTVQNGGPIALVQLDNELMGFHEWFGSWDYNRETMGIGKEDGRYGRFLRKRYGEMDALNEAYGERNKGFSEVLPFSEKVPLTLYEKRKCKDYQDFYFETCTEYFEILAGWLQEFGICTKLIHNSGNPNMNAYFKEMTKKLGDKFLLGSDHYYCLGPEWAQNNPTPQYGAKVFYSLEMLRLMGYPPAVYELPGGSASDWPPALPEDLECCYMLNVAFGMKGLNYYILTGGDSNPLELSYRPSYDFGAAVAGDGTVRKHYYTQKKVHRFLRENEWIENASQESDFYFGLVWEYPRSRHYDASGTGKEGFGNYEAWHFLRDGLFISALNGALSPEFIDLKEETMISMTDKPLIIAASHTMEAKIQKNIINFIKAGGKVAILPTIPVMDENFNTCTLLLDFLEAEADIPAKTFYNTLSEIGNIRVRDYRYRSTGLPREAEPVARCIGTGEVTGWYREYEEGGRVIWLGYDWRHQYFEQTAILSYLYEKLGGKKKVLRLDNPNIWAVIRSDDTHRMLFLMNLFASPQTVTWEYKKIDGDYQKAEEQTLAPMEVRAILLYE